VNLVFIAMLAGLSSGPAGQVGLPTAAPACRPVEVTLGTSTPKVKVGTRPTFYVSIANNDAQPVRVLNARDSRRTDLQEAYFELFVLSEGSIVDVPMLISDPGPISNYDYLTLGSGERLEVRPLSYKRVIERLPPGVYSAFILFWRDPELTHATRCRSSELRFAAFE
jgi:hypothetical protein